MTAAPATRDLPAALVGLRALRVGPRPGKQIDPDLSGRVIVRRRRRRPGRRGVAPAAPRPAVLGRGRLRPRWDDAGDPAVGTARRRRRTGRGRGVRGGAGRCRWSATTPAACWSPTAGSPRSTGRCTSTSTGSSAAPRTSCGWRRTRRKGLAVTLTIHPRRVPLFGRRPGDHARPGGADRERAHDRRPGRGCASTPDDPVDLVPAHRPASAGLGLSAAAAHPPATSRDALRRRHASRIPTAAGVLSRRVVTLTHACAAAALEEPLEVSGAVVSEPGSWWRHAVIYQVYPRSFADGER